MIITMLVVIIVLRLLFAKFSVAITFFGLIFLGIFVLMAYEAKDYSSGEGGIYIDTDPKPVKTVTKTVTKTIIKKEAKKPSYEDKMRRFEEEAFWLNVFDDDEF